MGSVPAHPSARRAAPGPAFWLVAFAFLAVMAMSALPSPLYPIYQERDGFSSFTVTLIYSAYAVGVIASLFFVGHVSDTLGRRRVLAPAVALSALSAVVFVLWQDLPGLFVARVLGGLAVGAVTATATAYLTELHQAARPHAGPRRAQLVAAASNIGGLGVGPLVAGIVADRSADPLTVPYLIAGAALLAGLAGVLSAPETRAAPDPRPAYQPQRVAVPDAARGAFFAAALGTLLSFAALGLFTGLAGVLLPQTFGESSRTLAGVTIFLVFGMGVVAQAAMTTWSVRAVLLGSTGALVPGMGLIVLSVWLPDPSVVLFLVGGAVAGAGGGALFKGTLGVVATIAEPERRAEALAGLFLSGYIGLSVPIVGLGLGLQVTSPRMVLLGFGAAVCAGVLAALPVLLRTLREDRGGARPGGTDPRA